ncbi:oxamate amidohydrolase proenzyme-like [Aricia agestis]|uniref:oxamate amidohydrolase proenzyme-like n=1 Tax=Aricia agestis TaxID=91739 RepID=UPI001C20A64B|nr:oxamate amidohydrolase proenzyme-like [Aricia agestis]XP_041970880.1 oxamate amidohydrolase proenzyme-like [Aricia agestis]
METSKVAPRGMVVTPHHLATQSALKVLRDGGTAMEAMVSAAATIAVVYPHMNSIGGDGFWLIVPPHGEPVAIEACGAAGSLATPQLYAGLDKIPSKGPKSAITVAGTVGGWEEALRYSQDCGYPRQSVSKLLADAIYYAENGFPMSKSQTDKLALQTEFEGDSEFKKTFVCSNTPPAVGQRFCQKNLARTLRELANNGLNSFYRGPLADSIAADMASLGMPITKSDLANYTPVRKSPLRVSHKHGQIFNLPPPTQGILSLSILATLEKLNIDGQHEGEFIHAVVEATKQAFVLRDKHITDPRYMKVDPNFLLSGRAISETAGRISLNRASEVGKATGPGDTVWMGVMDSRGFCVSFIQSVYHDFGSGVVLPKTGILWQNRGVSFSLKQDHIRALKPGKKPFHTLNPAAARLSDGRVMIYGTMGGDGQPQTQAAIFHRYVIQSLDLQSSVSAPRWLYGSIVGDNTCDLKIEDRFDQDTIDYLKDLGHNVVMLPKFSDTVGHAGALVRHPDGMLEGAFDPRSDGSAAGF